MKYILMYVVIFMAVYLLSFSFTEGGLITKKDDTGCLYLVTVFGGPTPKLNVNGVHICE